MLNGTFSVHLSLFLWAPIWNASFFGDKFHSERQCTGHNYELAFTRFPVSFSKQTKYRPSRKSFELKQIFINDDCLIVFNPSSFENVSVVIVGENVCRFFFLFAFLRAHFFGSRFIRAFSMWRFFCINWLLYHIVCYHFNVRVFLSLRSRFQFTKQNLSPSFLSMISAPFFLARLGVDVYLFVCSFSRSCRFGWRCIYFILCCLSSVSENFILVWTVSTSQKAI